MITFTSKISKDYIEDLKSLLFFNPDQQKVVSGIISSIDKYGLPEIAEKKDNLEIRVGNLIGVQSLFAFDTENNNKLTGIIIFFRENNENIVLLHIAIDEEYSFTGEHRNSFVAMRLINELKQISKSIKHIRNIIIYYQKDIMSSIKLK